jgi:exopolysaccharide production protein ExoQ
MPPTLALVLSILLILWLCWRDQRLSTGVSGALWIPVAWVSIIGSRFPSEWFAASGMAATTASEALVEGNPLNRNVFLLLMVAGVVVLLRRKIVWSLFVRQNIWLILFFCYTALSILWSDFPLTAFKRWHKVTGHVIMALIVWSEQDPLRAAASLFRRCGYILVTMSVVFIKYFPKLGWSYAAWTYEQIITGVTNNKNLLGNLCLIIGLFLVSALTVRQQHQAKKRPRLDVYIDASFLLATCWLLWLADSATSLMCLLVGSGIVVLTRGPFFARHFTKCAIAGVIVMAILELSVNLSELVITSLGRDTTLTGRTELWAVLAGFQTNMLFGTGFESFWLGDRIDQLWKIYWWQPNQAHNGYYETYLNLGLVGLFLQLGMMVSSYRKMERRLRDALRERVTDAAVFIVVRFGLAYLIAVGLYNMTEATFKALHFSYFVFFLVAIDHSRFNERVRDAVLRPPDERQPHLAPLGSYMKVPRSKSFPRLPAEPAGSLNHGARAVWTARRPRARQY